MSFLLLELIVAFSSLFVSLLIHNHNIIASVLCDISFDHWNRRAVPGWLLIDKIMIDVRVRPNPFRFDALDRPTEDRTRDVNDFGPAHAPSQNPITKQHKFESRTSMWWWWRMARWRSNSCDDGWEDDARLLGLRCRRCHLYLPHDIDGGFVRCLLNLLLVECWIIAMRRNWYKNYSTDEFRFSTLLAHVLKWVDIAQMLK